MPFVLDDFWNDLADLREDGGLALAQRDLVGDLVKVTGSAAAFAVKTSHGEVNLLQGAEDFLDLLGPPQGRQVKHDAGPHAGAHVRGACGQIAEFLTERISHFLLQEVVDLVDVLPGFVQRQTAAHHLKPKLIFFVDHQADRLALVKGHAARPLGGGDLAADQLPFDQELTVERTEAGDADIA